MAEPKVRREDVIASLSKVQEPELHQDLVTLNMIRDLVIEGNTVRFTVMLTTPACPLRGKIQQEAHDAVAKLPGVEKVIVNLSSNVPTDGKPRGLLQVPVKNAIAVASGKGGVGKSTVAVNLAVALASRGARVGLLDADIYGPNIPTMMGVDHIPGQKEEKMIPAEAYGVQMMSIGFLVRPGQPLIWRGPMLHSAIRQFLSDVAWGELDYLVIDLPPGTGDAQLSLAQSIPLTGAVIVTMPAQVSLDDTSRCVAMFQQLNVPILGVVENMSYLQMPDGTKNTIFGEGGGEALAKFADAPLFGKIPIDPAVRRGGDSGAPIVIVDPKISAAREMLEVAEKIAARVSVLNIQTKVPMQIEMED